MRLKELRQQKKLRQRDIADFLSCSTPVYCRYETGEREPPFDIIKKLADFHGVTVDYLMGVDTAQTTTQAQPQNAPAEKSEDEATTYSIMGRTDNGRSLYSQLNPADREIIDQMVRTLFEKTFGENGSSGKR